MGGFCLAQDPLPYTRKSVALTGHIASTPMMDQFCRTNDGQGVLSTPVSGGTSPHRSSMIRTQQPLCASCIKPWPIHAWRAASSSPDVTPGPTARSCPQSHDCFDGSLMIIWVNSYLRLYLPDLLRSINVPFWNTDAPPSQEYRHSWPVPLHVGAISLGSIIHPWTRPFQNNLLPFSQKSSFWKTPTHLC